MYGFRHAERRIIVSHPANPVAEPLPSAMLDQDLVARLPIAASLPAGTPVSKYFRDLNVEDFLSNSVHDSRWEVEAEDPAFASFPDESEIISKDELIERRRKMAFNIGQPRDEYEYLGEVYFPKSADSSGRRECEDVSGADGLPTPSQSHESEEERQAREQEEKLAALGVTGFAKPVRTSVVKSVVLATSAFLDTKEMRDTRDLPDPCGTSPGHIAKCVSSKTQKKPTLIFI